MKAAAPEILVGAAAVEAVWRLRHPTGIPTAKLYTGEFRAELDQIKHELLAAVPHLLVRVQAPEPTPEPPPAVRVEPIAQPPVICARCSAPDVKRPLTPQQVEIYQYIATSLRDRGFAPSFKEIAERMGFASLATVHEHLTNLQAKGWIVRSYNESRAISLVDSAA